MTGRLASSGWKVEGAAPIGAAPRFHSSPVRDQYLVSGVTTSAVDGVALAATLTGTARFTGQVIFTGVLLNCGSAGTGNVGKLARIRNQAVCWFVGLLGCWFVGLLVCWFVGLTNPQTHKPTNQSRSHWLHDRISIQIKRTIGAIFSASSGF
jgi:hypothetical protein